MFKYKTEEELSKMTAAERDQYGVDKRAHEAGELAKAVKVVKDEAALELKAVKDANDLVIAELKAANKATQDHADLLDVQLQKGGGAAGEGETLAKALEGFDIEKLKNNEGGFQEITYKAAVSMLPTTVNGTSSTYIGSTEVISGLNRPAEGDMNVMADADTSGTNAATIVWINKVNEEGNAAFIAPGVVKPLRSFEVAAETSNAKKVAVRFNVATETLEDFDFMAAEINKDGIQEVKRKTNEALLSSTGVLTQKDEPKGIIHYASAFALTSVKGEDPDNFGAIKAAAAQPRSLKFNPNRAYINPIDGVNMDLKKGANGHYVLPPFTTADGKKIGAITIVETDEIPVGYVLVGDMKKFHIRPYKGIQVKVGYNGEDFSKNMVTVIVEQRLHAYVNSIDTGAFVYDTFATIKAAIAIAPAEAA